MAAKTDYAAIASEHGTPFYLFDFDMARERVRDIRSRLPENARLCYAIKANAFLVRALKDEDILFEVCSPGELSACERIGLDPQKIVFSGVVKTFDDVRRACALGVNTITLESKSHAEYLVRAVRESEDSACAQDVILRLTGGNQFGMSGEDLRQCIALLKDKPKIRIRGIHFFTGTQKKIPKIREEVAFIQDFCDRLKEECGVGSLEIEYGPGLSYDYFSGRDEGGNFAALEEFAECIKDSPYNFVIELGRYVASPCGIYATRIADVKSDGSNRYCLIDGGINHINYYGQMMGMKNPPVRHIPQAAAFSNLEDYTVAGSLCTTADIVLRRLPLAAPAIGDLLVFGDIGAYSVTEGIYLFLSHPLPSVLAMSGGKIGRLRNGEETYILNS